jgi:hypothetical protein
MSNLIELSGRFFSEVESVPFEVVIHMPEQDSGSGDWLCRVVSSQLFSRDMEVWGVSRNQAVELAIAIVKAALTNKVVTEGDGPDDLDE